MKNKPLRYSDPSGHSYQTDDEVGTDEGWYDVEGGWHEGPRPGEPGSLYAWGMEEWRPEIQQELPVEPAADSADQLAGTQAGGSAGESSLELARKKAFAKTMFDPLWMDVYDYCSNPTLDAVSVGTWAAGQNYIATHGKFAGATEGTSIASSGLRKLIGDKTWRPLRSVPKIRTQNIGGALGRATPYVGVALMVVDVVDRRQCMDAEYERRMSIYDSLRQGGW